MADYKNYLAASILTEDKTVTYRLLSRALKVHINAAKEMLYDFHSKQNAKKPQSIHATYILSGIKRKEDLPNGEVKKDDDGDDYMQSSPMMSSSIPMPEEEQKMTARPPTLSITLVREEDLERIQAEYEEINSIHIYSLEPSSLKDLQVLSDVTRQLAELCASEDPLETNVKYGTITNPNARRRSARRPPPPVVAAPTLPKSEPAKAKPAESKPAPPKKEESKLKSATANDFFGKGKEKTKPKPADKGNTSSKESTPNPPALKRQGSSLMNAFSKSKPKIKCEGTDIPAVASPVISAAEDSPMKDVSDDEEDSWVAPPSKVTAAESRQARKDREAALKKMMDESDDEVVETPKENTQEEEKQPLARSESPTTEDPPVAGDGRRRGKRRVMKKKVMKDEDGYLVTKEEAVWDSFSEDEPVAKPKPKPVTSSSTATKKKAAPKAGQGNIMSFFGKK